MDPKILKQIDEYGELSNEIDRITHELKQKAAKFKTIENSLRPTLEALKVTGINSIETKKYLITIKKAAYEKSNPKYAEAFDLAMTKVNAATQRVLQEALDANTTTSQVVAKLGVQKIGESVISNVMAKISKFFNRIANNISGENRKLQEYNEYLMRIVKH